MSWQPDLYTQEEPRALRGREGDIFGSGLQQGGLAGDDSNSGQHTAVWRNASSRVGAGRGCAQLLAHVVVNGITISGCDYLQDGAVNDAQSVVHASIEHNI